VKVLVSADTGGVAGITSSDDASEGQAGCAPFRSQMGTEPLVFLVGL
jgi:D-aminopeptidase